MVQLLRVELSPNALELEPGASATLTVRIVNTSSIVERYTIAVVGVAERWATVTPPELPLMPDTDGTVEITVAAPAERPPAAGGSVVGVKVTSTRTEASWVEELELRISPVARATLVLAPELRRTAGTADYEAILDNQGNVPLNLQLRGEDQERTARFQFTPPALEVWPEDEPARVRVRVSAPRRWTGPDQTRMLTVHADGAPQPLQASATFVQRSRLASGLLRGIGGFAAAAVIAGAIVVPRLLDGDDAGGSTTTTGGVVTSVTAPQTSDGGGGTTTAPPTTTDGGTTTSATATTVPLGEPVVVRFDTRPDGGPLTGDVLLSGNEYAAKGIQLRGVPQPGHCDAATQTAIRIAGANQFTVPHLTSADPSDITQCNTSPIEVVFSQPARAVTLTFTGADARYTMEVFDSAGQRVASLIGDAVLGGLPVQLSSPAAATDIARVTFGRATSPTAVTEIRYRR